MPSGPSDRSHHLQGLLSQTVPLLRGPCTPGLPQHSHSCQVRTLSSIQNTGEVGCPWRSLPRPGKWDKVPCLLPPCGQRAPSTKSPPQHLPGMLPHASLAAAVPFLGERPAGLLAKGELPPRRPPGRPLPCSPHSLAASALMEQLRPPRAQGEDAGTLTGSQRPRRLMPGLGATAAEKLETPP